MFSKIRLHNYLEKCIYSAKKIYMKSKRLQFHWHFIKTKTLKNKINYSWIFIYQKVININIKIFIYSTTTCRENKLRQFLLTLYQIICCLTAWFSLFPSSSDCWHLWISSSFCLETCESWSSKHLFADSSLKQIRVQ